jgi:putative membrane protein
MMYFGGLGMLLMILFWGAIIALIVWGVLKLNHSEIATSAQVKDNPLDVAKQRYAKGEISREEFDQIKKDLY